MENWERLPLCRDDGIVVQVYSPLEQGLLTGTITRDYVPGGARANKVWFQRENMLKVIDMLEQSGSHSVLVISAQFPLWHWRGYLKQE